jgi:hypothetical protein
MGVGGPWGSNLREKVGVHFSRGEKPRGVLQRMSTASIK